MNQYSVYTTENFGRKFTKLSAEEQKRVKKIFLQLKENPYVGDQIRYKNFREKRLSEKRIYYLVYDDLHAVLIVAIGGKKIQQETIDHIIPNLREYKNYLKRILKENS